MKISYNWLKEYIDFDLTPMELSHILTMLGLETEGKPLRVGGVEGNFEGIVVGHVVEQGQHPNADRLSVCKVDVGGEELLDIVCGAPNVAAGQNVAVATVGSMMYPAEGDPFKIKKGKIRGEVSLGMICAEDELGLGEGHDGIMVLDAEIKPGTPFIEAADIEQDWMIEIDLTPNRIDSASHYGVARDLAAFLKTDYRLPEISISKDDLKLENPISVEIQAKDKCKRYTSVHIKNIKVGTSPEWLQNRLITIGLRPKNSIVDITNYVLHELGQPMHAFDADKLEGNKIVVREVGEKLKYPTLDGMERDLEPTDLLICDAKNPRCIAGTMGGEEGSVTETTTNIFLESAYFDPGAVRRTAKRLGINSDSSYRFERGADPAMTENAALRATALILEICGGEASKLETISTTDFPNFEVSLSVDKTERMIGKKIGKETIIDILKRLDIEVKGDGDMLQLEVPPYRVDVQRPQDVMEEILRIYGYDDIEPAVSISQTMSYQQYHNRDHLLQRYCDMLSANGFYEILNNSLINKNLGDDNAVNLVNPLSEELGTMRQSLLPGFLDSIQHNQNRQVENMAFYELGSTYWKDEKGYGQKRWIGLAVTGKKHEQHWTGGAEAVSLFTLGREVERLQKYFDFKGRLRECEHDEFAYGMELLHKKKQILYYGRIKDELIDKWELKNEVFYMAIDRAALLDIHIANHELFKPIAQYPSMRRDISMLVDEGSSFVKIQGLVARSNPKLIRSVDLHDVYKGKGIPEGKKSYLISVLFQDERKTLEDKSIDKITAHIYRQLEKEMDAEIRR